MKTKNLIFIIVFVWSTLDIFSQGYIYFGSQTAPTRLGTPDGPLAGTNIVSQLLVGYSANNLLPTGDPQLNHNGIFVVTPISVASGAPGDLVYVQLSAWDKTLWGLSYSGIPESAKGSTDVITYYLDSKPANPPLLTFFTSSAVVPSSVPEPNQFALLSLGAIGLIFCEIRRKMRLGRG